MLDLIPIHCHNPAFVNYGFKGYDKMFKIQVLNKYEIIMKSTKSGWATCSKVKEIKLGSCSVERIG